MSSDRLKRLRSALVTFDDLIKSTPDTKIVKILQKHRLQIEHRISLVQIYQGGVGLLKNLNTSKNKIGRTQRLFCLGQVIWTKLKQLFI